MNNIIEKLGITKAPWKLWGNGDIASEVTTAKANPKSICKASESAIGRRLEESNKNMKLIASAPEMLETLILMGLENTNYEERHEECRAIVEKATGKSWSEIKELLV